MQHGSSLVADVEPVDGRLCNVLMTANAHCGCERHVVDCQMIKW